MADIKAIFKYPNDCRRKIFSGIRPAVRIADDYLTTCLLTFSESEMLNENIKLDKEFEVEGIFISPEYYPNCLWVGRVLEAYEGSTLIGYLTVTKILNPILLK